MATPQIRISPMGEAFSKPLQDRPALRLLSAEQSDEIFPILIEELVGLGFSKAMAVLVDFEAGIARPVAALNCSKSVKENFTAPLWAAEKPLIAAMRKGQPAVIDGPRSERFFCSPIIYSNERLCWEADREHRADCLAIMNSRQARSLDLQQQVCAVCNMRAYSAAVLVGVEKNRADSRLGKAAGLIQLANRYLSRLFKVEHYYNRMRDMEINIAQRDTVMMSMADPVILTDAQLRVITQNRAAERFFKLPSEQESATQGAIRAVELNNLLFSATLSSLSVAGREDNSRDITLVDVEEGREVLFEAVCAPTIDTDGLRSGLVTVMRNVTDLRRADVEVRTNLEKLRNAEEVLRQDRDRLDLVIRNVGDPIIVADHSAKMVLLDPLAQELLGKRTDENSSAALAAEPKIIKNQAKIDAYLQGFIFFSTTRNETRSITLYNPSVSAEVEYEVRSGKILDSRGQVSYCVTVLRDFSAWKKLEQLKTERHMLEIEKFSATGRLAGTIAHEVNNPMEAIKNAIHLLDRHVDSEGKPLYDILLKETQRVASIVRQMLGLYRHGENVVSFELNAVIEDTLALFNRQLSTRGVTIKRQLQNIPAVLGSADQMRQVVSNLVVNASDSMDQGGMLVIRTRYYLSSDGLHGWVRISIADTGCGINPQIETSIFDPFVTTKGEKGTGLGLWIVKGIIETHRGKIRVKSKLGRGTVFRIDLPVIR